MINFYPKGKRGDVLHEIIIQIIIIAIVIVASIFAVEAKANTNGVKQQILEKELAIIIDASDNGYKFEVSKQNRDGLVDKIEIRDGRIFVGVNGFFIGEGYPFFSAHKIRIEEDKTKFIIIVE